ncbi:MAG: aspartate aminotransferase family protein [Cyclobacteriaceae bacterium]
MSIEKKKILALEHRARQLEPSATDRKTVRDQVLEYTEQFLNEIEETKTFQFESNKGKGLQQHPFAEKPQPIESSLQLIRDEVDFPALNPASGGHFGYIPGGGIYYAALGDYMADIANRYAGIYFASPGAVRMENMLLQWVADLMGYPKTAAGNITSGGSIANLIAICTARDAKKITSRNIRKSVIYLTRQAHHSLDKAIRIAGLNECVLRYIEMDEAYRMDAKALAKQVESDKKKKLNPFLLLASAGTTDVGAIDPLEKLATLCKKYNLWYHIDAAYGGFFVLTAEGKRKLKGIGKSDSLVIDPHKGMFLPYGIGMVLVKNKLQLAKTHHYQANYMQDAKADNEELSPADLSPELTKHFRGLRMWLPLRLHGIAPFRACLEEKLALAKYFHREVRKMGFETGAAPELSVVVFRYVPKTGDPDKYNKNLAEAIRKDGYVFVSTTQLRGKFMLRLACLSFRSHLYHIEYLLHQLKKLIS